MMKQLCRICGKEFMATDNRQKICSDACREVSKKQAFKKYYNSIRKCPEIRACCICGKLYKGKTNSVVCSPECRKRLKYERYKQYSKENYKNDK